MKASYRKHLEKIAKQMILIHRADVLVKLVLRTVVRTLKIKHAGIFVYDKKRDEYVAYLSKGSSGFRIPVGFVKITQKSPLIRYFTDSNLNLTGDILTWPKLNHLLRAANARKDSNVKRFFEDIKTSFSLYDAKACIPGFFRKDLIGLFFLGDKINRKDFSEDELGFLSVLASDVVMALKNAWLIGDLNYQLKLNKDLFLQTVSALASSIEAKDKYTSGHTERVVKYSLAIARIFKKTKSIKDQEQFIEDMRIAALLHDIGKIGIPENILNKPSRLDDEERKIIEKHPLIGVNILNHIDAFQQVLLGVKHHHERYDGKGYPAGLKNRQIPLIASVIACADAFDAMTTDRPYRPALSFEEAVEELKNNKGKQFAPGVVNAFLRYIKEDNECFSAGVIKKA